MNANLSGVRDFIKDLWHKVNDPKYDEHIHWNKDGTGFLIVNEARFAFEVLNRKNFASYQRNIYNYGFSKLKKKREFVHLKFNRAHPELLKEIDRKFTKQSRKKRKLAQNMTKSNTGQERVNIPTTGAVGEGVTLVDGTALHLLQEGESASVGAAYGFLMDDFFNEFGIGDQLAQNPTTSNAVQGELNDQTTGAVGGVPLVDGTALHMLQEGESASVGAAYGFLMDDLFNGFEIGDEMASSALQGLQGCSVSSIYQVPVNPADSKDSDHASAKAVNNLPDKIAILHSASKNGNIELMELMLLGGVGIDSRDSDGFTPLIVTACLGKPDAFELLIERGADTSLKHDGWSLLHCAALGGNTSIIKKLLSLKLDINSKSSEGETPLMIAASMDQPDAFQLFIQRGADTSLKGNDGWSLLHCAAYGGNTSIINKVLSLKLDINLRDNKGKTPLILATDENKTEAAKYLINNGALDLP